MTTTAKKTVTVGNLYLAKGRSVAIPATIGVHLGRGFSEFALSSLECCMLGNDAFTEVYFTTVSGNCYKIYQMEDRFGQQTDWFVVNVRDNKGRKGALVGYAFPEAELLRGVLKVGQPFRYGGGGVTSEVVAVLCVNASKCYVNGFQDHHEFTSDIRSEFNRMIGT